MKPIVIIALVVFAAAIVLYFIRLGIDKRRLEREAIRRSVEDAERRERMKEPAENCFVIDPKPFKLWKSGALTFGEAINETRRLAGYSPLTFRRGEDRAFWPNMTTPDPDDQTKTWPGPPGHAA